MENLKHKLDIQLFAEDPQPDLQPTSDPQEAHPKPVIDYEKLAEAVSGRAAAAGESALKGYLEDQGLSKDEMDAAIKEFKERKKAKEESASEELQRLKNENQTYKEKERLDKMMTSARAIAKELSVRDDRFEKLLALCDQSGFTDDKGTVNESAIKKELEKQLKEVPEFASRKQIVITKGSGVDVPPAMTDAEEYRKRRYGNNRYYRG